MTRSQLIGPALGMLRAAGGDVAAMIARFGLPAGAERAAESVLPLPVLIDLLDACAVAIGDESFGLHLAACMPRGAYGVLEFASLSAPTIRAAFHRIARYMQLLNEVATVRVEEAGGVATIEHRIVGSSGGLGQHGNEMFVAVVLGRFRLVTGRPCIPERAWFAHPTPAPGAVERLKSFLGTTLVRFAAGSNGMAIASAVLDLPLSTSDPPLMSLLDRTAERSLAGLAGASQLTATVRRHLHASLGDAPSLESTAAALSMSARTLQRRLAAETTSFQQVLDDVRHKLAIELLQDPRRSLSEVAFLLGYAELSPFLRAFKRWTGKRPTAVRL